MAGSLTHLQGINVFDAQDSRFQKGELITLQLKEDERSKKECHLFFTAIPSEDSVIATALRFLSFNPKSVSSEKFGMLPMEVHADHQKKVIVWWCHFPAEFKDVCERVGRLYGMNMKSNQMQVLSEDGVCIIVSPSPSCLVFEGNKCLVPDVTKVYSELQRVTFLGDQIEKLGVD
jgi:hypothetical protein